MNAARPTRALALLTGLLLTTACDPEETPTQDAGPRPDAADAALDTSPDAQADVDLRALPDCAPPGARFFSDLTEAQVNGWTVRASGRDGSWSIELPPAAAALPSCLTSSSGLGAPTRVSADTMSVRYAVGSFRTLMSTMDWVLTDQDVEVAAAGGNLTITTASGAGSSTLAFAPEGASDLRVTLETTLPDARAGEIGIACAPGEGFFGLGAQTFGMDLRGGRFPLVVQEQGIGKPETGQPFPFANIPEASYAPMGVWHSSRGYAALLTHDGYSELDVCDQDDSTLALRSFDAMPGFVLVSGDTPRDRMTSLTAYTGRASDPPDWVFAPWNDAVGGPDRLQQVADTLRAEGIPSSAIWSEDWIGGESSATGFRLSYAWEWDPVTYPDLPGDVARLHEQGFAFLAYFNPFVPNTTRMYQEGVDGGFLVTDAAGDPLTQTDPALRQAGLVDLYDPAARDWYRSYMVTAARDLAIDGWMTDFAEWLPIDAVTKAPAGSDPWALHNLYTVEQQRVHREAMEQSHPAGASEPENNWTFFARSGWASALGGTPGISPTMWGGDQTTDFGYDDGFPTALTIGAHLGLSGVAIYGSDVAGYSSLGRSPTDKELFLRWSSLGAFHPLMRTHHGDTKCEHWAFDRDPETLDHYRRWASIHTLLFPYLRDRMREATSRGWPITRHAYLVEPGNPALWTGDQYLYFLGDGILVAPVLTQGATSREVVLPGEGWWPLLGDAPVSSAGAHTAQAPPTELPVFARPGLALPLLPSVVDSFYGASRDGVTDLSDVEGHLRLALYPAPDGAVASEGAIGGDLSVTGAGLSAQTDLSTARLDGQALGACPDDDAVGCVDAAGLVRVRGDEVALEFDGGATLTLSGATPRTVTIGLGGAAFGALAQPTTVTDLDPDVTPPCLVE
jgi:alpha-glucosidase (family GH31 glycosyl hydrolase)